MSSVKQANHVSRITLLDSKYLDNEVKFLVESQLFNIVKYVHEDLIVRLKPEVDAVLNYVILYHTVQKKGQSVGQQLLNIKYENSTEKNLKLYVLILTVVPYLKNRLSDITTFLTGRKSNIDNNVQIVFIFYKVLQIVNLLIFLTKGKYPTVEEYLFKLKQAPKLKEAKRQISYTYFTRELLWHGFAELLGFVLPFINIQLFHNTIKNLLPSAGSSGSADESDVNMKLNTTCSICNKKPILPHCYGCEHMACYFCIYSSYSSAPSFRCPLCTHSIETKMEISPVRPMKDD